MVGARTAVQDHDIGPVADDRQRSGDGLPGFDHRVDPFLCGQPAHVEKSGAVGLPRTRVFGQEVGLDDDPVAAQIL